MKKLICKIFGCDLKELVWFNSSKKEYDSVIYCQRCTQNTTLRAMGIPLVDRVGQPPRKVNNG